MTKMHRNKFLARFSFISGIAAFVLFLFFSAPTNGDFWWFDSSRHAMNGVFIRDLLLEGGLWHPISFASEYYRQYPGINIGFYPPLLYLTSAPFLAVFGTGHPISQAVVSLYAFLAGAIIYLICAREMDRLSSMATALCVLALPQMALLARQIQLDVPAVALLLAAAYCLIRHLDGGRSNWLFATAACVGLAILMRVQAVLAVPVILFFLGFYKYEQRPRLGMRIAAVTVAGLIALPSVLMVAYFSQINQSLAMQMPGMPKLFSVANWLWYAKALPQQMGWPAVVWSIAGLLACGIVLRKEEVPVAVKVLAAFGVCSWVFFTIVSNKDPRFNLPSLPFLFMVAALGFNRLAPRVARVSLLVLATWSVFQVTFSTVPVVTGFKEAALAAQSITPANGNVLISAHRDGSFIYNMRTLGERRDIGIRRADKLIVEFTIMREFGIKETNLSPNEIVELLKQQNISVIVAQTDYLSDLPSMRNFQKFLEQGSIFERLQTIPLQGATNPNENELVIYKRKAGS
jgi:hypothetical protein